MKNFKAMLILTLVLMSSFDFLILVFSLRLNPNSSDLCDNKVDPRTLRLDQMTVVISGYSEHRIPLLQSIAARYSAAASVSSILILWCNPATPTQTISQLSKNLSHYSTVNAPISVIHETTASLNSRFYPRESIDTRAVLICDDDLELDSSSIDFAFNIWKSNPNRLIGFFARSHAYDLSTKSWIYTISSDKYSIILTKAMVMKWEYLWEYSCGGGKVNEELRKIVDAERNCEDILMNFVVADKVNAGPILAGAERVRDWGDARNEGGVGKEEREAGLSSRRGEHRKRRGDCIREFHRVLGRMPLRYSYGKLVKSVGEQGLCEKSGKLVYCDQQVFK
ncbi:glycosyltransferase family protein 64 C3 isoform X1 [Coffea eugenioides]|uniref:glycosyltransferase family protein 64 C3 isoform X1 n=1 Tax=Coffea eugenioides TaxID=49369 RepID=UPI000F614CE5|nr:glycosyltransferase family protein 64 C3 isoform X1 [Coffea eugenioides]